MEIEAKHILTAPNIVCSDCGSKTFMEVAVLKRISAILSPSGKEEIYPIPVFVCSKCGKIPQEYMDKQNAKYILGEIKDENDEKSVKSGLITNV